MKTTQHIITNLLIALTLILIIGQFPATAQTASRSTGNVFIEAYDHFINDNMEGVISAMASLNMDLDREKTVALTPSGSLDSLIFEGPNGKTTFSAVDLGYIKNVTVVSQFTSNEPKTTLNQLVSAFTDESYVINPDFVIPGVCAAFGEQNNYWVVDRRFAKPSYTKFESLYEHVFTTFENEVQVSLTEVVPQEYIIAEQDLTNEVPLALNN